MSQRKHIPFTIKEGKSIVVNCLANELLPILSWLKLALWLDVGRRTHNEEISLVDKIEYLLKAADFLVLEVLEDLVVWLFNEDSLALLEVVPLKHYLVDVVGLSREH